MMKVAEASRRVCGREWSAEDLAEVRKAVEQAQPRQRAEIARRVCRALDWNDALGRPKLMSCRVALLRLHRAGHIELPAPTKGNGNRKGLTREPAQWPAEERVDGLVGDLSGLRLEPVSGRAVSALWNGLIDRYHYLGYTRLPGAQMRYLIRWRGGLPGALGFGAAAWKAAARDRWIGWSPAVREAHLARVINNARFLILPWVEVKNLASRVLSLASRRVAEDFETRYGTRPVLLETFVEQQRFRGTCYRAANWVRVGETKGRGKCDRHCRAQLPVKDIYLYPLQRDFRQALGVRS
jgi:hypothetical protein